MFLIQKKSKKNRMIISIMVRIVKGMVWGKNQEKMLLLYK
jgi:hypothetical protein